MGWVAGWAVHWHALPVAQREAALACSEPLQHAWARAGCRRHSAACHAASADCWQRKGQPPQAGASLLHPWLESCCWQGSCLPRAPSQVSVGCLEPRQCLPRHCSAASLQPMLQAMLPRCPARHALLLGRASRKVRGASAGEVARSGTLAPHLWKPACRRTTSRHEQRGQGSAGKLCCTPVLQCDFPQLVMEQCLSAVMAAPCMHVIPL